MRPLPHFTADRIGLNIQFDIPLCFFRLRPFYRAKFRPRPPRQPCVAVVNRARANAAEETDCVNTLRDGFSSVPDGIPREVHARRIPDRVPVGAESEVGRSIFRSSMYMG